MASFATWLDHWQTLAARVLGIITGSFAPAHDPT
jgi:hypothetical protein